MNDKEKENILKIARKCSEFCISIDIFCTILIDQTLKQLLDPVTNIDMLKTGFYGTFCGSQCFVKKSIPSYHVSISYTKNYKNEPLWMVPVKLEKFDFVYVEKLFKLKAFW